MFFNESPGFYIYFYGVIIFILISTATFLLEILNYTDSQKKITYYPDIDYDLYFSGLKDFEFNSQKPGYYTPTISNLGQTGNLIYECMIGSCRQWVTKTCETSDDTDTDIDPYYVSNNKKIKKSENDSKLRKLGETYDCSEYDYYEVQQCGQYCREHNKLECDQACPLVYEPTGVCVEIFNTDYTSLKACNAHNLNLMWKNLFYERTNFSNSELFSYSKNAYEFEKECPEGTRFCGYLDELKNKLCLSYSYENCPYNDYSVGYKKNSSFSYTEKTLPGGEKLYLTRDNLENGRVIDVLIADTDLLIKYNECEIIEEGKISEFINENFRAYYKTLDYNPYDVDDIDSKGKSYLRICNVGYNAKEKNITIIKEQIAQNNFLMQANNDFISPILKSFETQFILYTIGYGISFVSYILVTIDLILMMKKNYDYYYCCRCIKSPKSNLQCEFCNIVTVLAILLPFFFCSALALSYSSKNIDKIKQYLNEVPESTMYDLETREIVFIVLIIILYFLVFIEIIIHVIIFLKNYRNHSSKVLVNQKENLIQLTETKEG